MSGMAAFAQRLVLIATLEPAHMRICKSLPRCGMGGGLHGEEQFPAHIPSKKSGLGVFCSTCHKHADNMYDYCPNCGAKMDGEEKR